MAARAQGRHILVGPFNNLRGRETLAAVEAGATLAVKDFETVKAGRLVKLGDVSLLQSCVHVFCYLPELNINTDIKTK